MQAQDLVFNENVLLQTLGFDVAIDHPHTHVVRTCHLVKGEAIDVTELQLAARRLTIDFHLDCMARERALLP